MGLKVKGLVFQSERFEVSLDALILDSSVSCVEERRKRRKNSMHRKCGAVSKDHLTPEILEPAQINAFFVA